MHEQNKFEFPVFRTKVEDLERTFDLTNPEEQKEYFQAKAGEEIRKLQNYLARDAFIGYFLAKKNAGKGTYSKMFAGLVGTDKVDHIAVGDMVRGLDAIVQNPEKKEKLIAELQKTYRGWISLEEIVSSLEQRSTASLLPTELILALVKLDIAKRGRKALFIDGFPRNLDQISYSLFFRDLVGYRDDPDFFVLIDVPTAVIDERIKWRRVCPTCQTSRNLRLLTTSKIGYREETGEFYLMCDNPECPDPGTELMPKEGDEQGTAPIANRIAMDQKLMEQAFSLHGIPKVFLRNTVPVELADEYIDKYEITPEYVYKWDEKEQRARVIEKPWIISDDHGTPSYSLLPQAVVVSLIKQVVRVLKL